MFRSHVKEVSVRSFPAIIIIAQLFKKQLTYIIPESIDADFIDNNCYWLLTLFKSYYCSQIYYIRAVLLQLFPCFVLHITR